MFDLDSCALHHVPRGGIFQIGEGTGLTEAPGPEMDFVASLFYNPEKVLHTMFFCRVRQGNGMDSLFMPTRLILAIWVRGRMVPVIERGLGFASVRKRSQALASASVRMEGGK